MYNDIYSQLFLFFVFFVVGVVIALVFDTLRAAGRVAFSGIFFFVLKDIIFWIITTFLVFFICLKYNDGEMRFFMFVAVTLGALVYFKTVSTFVVKLLCLIIQYIKKSILFILKLIFLPLKFINKPVFIALSVSKRGFVNLVQKISFKLKVLKKFKRKY